jgi:hypothetical protein
MNNQTDIIRQLFADRARTRPTLARNLALVATASRAEAGARQRRGQADIARELIRWSARDWSIDSQKHYLGINVDRKELETETEMSDNKRA